MSTTLILLIIALILILVIIAVIAYWDNKIKQKVSDISRAAFGTSSVLEGIDQMQKDYAGTPKSVAAMTSVYLPNIIRDFPHFQFDEMREKAQNALCSYLLAVSSENASLLQEGNSDLRNKLDNQIQILKQQNMHEHFEGVRIHRTEISAYRKAGGRCIITFQSGVEYIHYVMDQNRNVVKGNRDSIFQSKYDVDLIYIQDRNLVEDQKESSLGLNCPNCGAPLTMLGAKECEYCGSPVVELNIHVWSFGEIREITR